jgi:hypothetical protein
MTDIEKKALALLNEVMFTSWLPHELERIPYFAVVCRAIEQHEAFRQEVSDAVESLCNTVLMGHGHRQMREMLSRRFIIAKPDPLVEALKQLNMSYVDAEDFREALAKRGGKIVWEND